jgi:hypothetical protein
LKCRQSVSYSRICQNFMEPKVHYCVHKSPPLVFILNQINSVRITLRLVSILSSHLHLGLPRSLFPSGLPTKSPIFFPLLPMSTTYAAHLILLEFILLLYLAKGTSTSYHFFPFRAKILLSTLFSNNLAPCSSHNITDQV